MEEVLDQDTNGDFGISESDANVAEGEGLYACLGKPATNTLELSFLADLVDHEVEPPSASGSHDSESLGYESDYGKPVGECKSLPKLSS